MFILLLMLCFDPLAILLIIQANYLIKLSDSENKKAKDGSQGKQQEGRDTENTTPTDMGGDNNEDVYEYIDSESGGNDNNIKDEVPVSEAIIEEVVEDIAESIKTNDMKMDYQNIASAIVIDHIMDYGEQNIHTFC